MADLLPPLGMTEVDVKTKVDEKVIYSNLPCPVLMRNSIVKLSVWCHDIGREQAANKPLLKTVFQVMIRMYMLFSISTPLENLEPVLREDIQKIWDSVPKSQAHKETPLSDFFNVERIIFIAGLLFHHHSTALCKSKRSSCKVHRIALCKSKRSSFKIIQMVATSSEKSAIG